MSKKLKQNPLIKSKKNKKLNVGGDGEENEVKRFIIILAVIAVIVLGIYFVTDLFKNKKEEEVATPQEVNYDILSIGTLLKAPYDDYYAIIFSSKDSNAALYEALMSTYSLYSFTSDYKKLYYIDLDNKLNSEYYNVGNDNKSNPKAKKVSELDLGDITLIEVKKGTIVKYVDDYEQINKILSYNN